MPAPTDMPPSIMSHVSIGTNDYARAKTFYDAVVATLHIGSWHKIKAMFWDEAAR